MPIISVLDSYLAYTDTDTADPAPTAPAGQARAPAGQARAPAGQAPDRADGPPIVFLHGNPASSRLWRNVIPPLAGRSRCLAPDLIGMGASGKPDIGYRFADHARYLDAWFDAAGLDEVVLVGHDWGGALAFDWAARHPGRVRGITFLETIVRPMTWADLSPAARARFTALREPGTGEELALAQNTMITAAFTGAVRHPLSAADLDAYTAPYPDRASRRPLLEWALALPVDGAPADVVSRVEAYDRWLAGRAGVPKLLLTFDSSPTLLITPELAAWCAARMPGLEVRPCGPAGHHAPEDQPAAIAAAIGTWADRHRLRRAAGRPARSPA
jgi:haloalkane dehalogenase